MNIKVVKMIQIMKPIMRRGNNHLIKYQLREGIV